MTVFHSTRSMKAPQPRRVISGSGHRALLSAAARVGTGAGTVHEQASPAPSAANAAPTMENILRVALLASCFNLATFTNPVPACTMELACAECVPDNMPLVTSHRAANGSVRAAHGDEVLLSCAGGKFAAYPLLGALAAACEAGRYRVRHDGALRHLLELGCQENVFEDVLHQVEHCAAPRQGRAYLVQEAGAGARHVATLCFDADRAVAAWAHAAAAPRNRLPMPPHAERAAPLSLLGNFNHMFDASTRTAAERLFLDDTRLTRRLHELFKYDDVSLAGHSLTSGKLLSGNYFEDQNMRVTEFASNRVATWSSVAAGNLRHLQRDVARVMRARAALHVYAGTHGVASLRAGGARRAVFLRPERFPMPQYMWTVVVDPGRARALALVLVNDPLVAVSEVRALVFCESACGGAAWLRALRTNRNYETPAMGLVFCCDVHNFTAVVTEMPKEFLERVPRGEQGMLMDFLD